MFVCELLRLEEECGEWNQSMEGESGGGVEKGKLRTLFRNLLLSEAIGYYRKECKMRR